MNNATVRIVEMEPQTLICFNGYGSNPEDMAFKKLFDWAHASGVHGRVFGYNNPNPSEGSPNYGYDACMVVDPATQIPPDATAKTMAGGTYAVLNCQVRDPYHDIGTAWRSLARWINESNYTVVGESWYEEKSLYEKKMPEGILFELDLHLPIKPA